MINTDEQPELGAFVLRAVGDSRLVPPQGRPFRRNERTRVDCSHSLITCGL